MKNEIAEKRRIIEKARSVYRYHGVSRGSRQDENWDDAMWEALEATAEDFVKHKQEFGNGKQ